MVKILFILILPSLVFSFDIRESANNRITSFDSMVGNSLLGKGKKKIYKAVDNSVKASLNIAETSVDIIQAVNSKPNGKERVKELTPEERQEFLQKQFTSKEDILNMQTVKKEEINVDMEVTEFFNSLNMQEQKPVNIE